MGEPSDPKLIVRPYRVSISGHGFGDGDVIRIASSRAKAVYLAFQEYREHYDVSFAEFIRRARAYTSSATARFGEAITVSGKPAYYVGHNSQYIRFVYANADVVFNTHPLDVEPPEARRGTPYYEPAA